MAELILTDEEKAMSIAQLSNETVGMITKKPMFSFEKDADEDDRTPWYIKVGLICWANKLVDMNATDGTATIWGATSGDRRLGNWKLTIERLGDAPQDDRESSSGRSVELVIKADDLAPGRRLSTAFALIRSGLTALLLGRMSITVAKSWRVTDMKVSHDRV